MHKTLKAWLIHQCRIVPGAKYAVLLTGPPDQGPYDQALYWPDENWNHTALSRVAQAALQVRQVVIKTRHNEVSPTGEPLDALACPLLLNGGLLGVVAFEMTHRSQSMQQSTAEHLQAGAKWLETMLLLMDSTAQAQMVNLIDLVATALENEKFHVAATDVANELAARYDCNRVSLGFMRNNRVRVDALSHSSRIDHHSNLVCKIQEAMHESVDQGEIIIYPPASKTTFQVTQFHARLAEKHSSTTICTLPLVKNDRAVGALMLERSRDKPFTSEMVRQIEQIALLLGPVLETRRNDERPLYAKIFDSIRRWCGKLFGPRHPGIKAGVVAGSALLIWLSTAQATFHISGDSVLEAKICRAVIAPQQGYIASAHVRAGDLVRAGDRLASLDDRDLMLEQRKWQSQYAQLHKEYRKALTGIDRAQVAIFKAKRAQAEAQLKLVEQQLERIKMMAPFDGLVVKGDLSQAIGSPVERGEVLFKIAPNNNFRVVIKVEDRNIGLIRLRQEGRLKLSGIPDRSITVTIDRITPVATSEQGRNYFRVEAVMDGPSDLLRPGMQGITKIEVGHKKRFWIWTRSMVDWLRLFVWHRLPW
jgi:RND family efflux transporter MFP subunit